MNFSTQMNAVVAYKQYIIAGSNDGDIIVINNSTFDVVQRIVRPNYQIHSLYIKQTIQGTFRWNDSLVEKEYLLVHYRNNCIELFEL